MLRVLDHAALALEPALRDSMLRDRAAQFVLRHGWALPLTDGEFEVDEFDAPGTAYCILTDGARHAASLRLRAAHDGSMVERHFGGLWSAFGDELGRSYEVTRLCLAPGRAPAHPEALSELLVGLCSYCLGGKISEFFGVVFPSVVRALSRAGWPPHVLGTLKRPGETLLLARWEVSHLIYWALEEEQERRANGPAASTAEAA